MVGAGNFNQVNVKFTRSFIFCVRNDSFIKVRNRKLFFTRLGNLNSNKTGYTNSFLLGFLTVIVATPCTGPYMGAAIGWGIAQPALVSTSIFLSLGLGIAFPTLILSILPKGIRLLPKPGNWMGALSRLMAVPMFLTAMWLT